MNKKINIFTNLTDSSCDVKAKLIKKLENRNYVVAEKYDDDAVLNIAIGGDGSFLNAVHSSNFSSTPFVGINTGSLGYFQEINMNKLDEFIDDYENGNYYTDELLILKSIFYADGKEVGYKNSLNELVVRSITQKIIHLDVCIDDFHFQTIAGDGVIFSTPSGSTAYNLSLGGAILYQYLKGYQMVPIAPIRSKIYRPLQSPLVLSEETEVKIKIHMDEQDKILISSDGLSIDESEINEVKITIPKNNIKKLVFNPTWYWQNIKDKLL